MSPSTGDSGVNHGDTSGDARLPRRVRLATKGMPRSVHPEECVEGFVVVRGGDEDADSDALGHVVKRGRNIYVETRLLQ